MSNIPSIIYVLLIHKDPTVRRIAGVHRYGSDGGSVSCRSVGSVSEALVKLDERKWDLILLESRLPDFSGLDGYTIIKEKCNGVPILIYASRADEETALKAVHHGAVDYLIKDTVSAEDLRARILKIVGQVSVTKCYTPFWEGWGKGSSVFLKIITELPNGVMVIGADHTLRLVNSAACVLMDSTSEELVGCQFIIGLKPGQTVTVERDVAGRVKKVEIKASQLVFRREQLVLLVLREIVEPDFPVTERINFDMDPPQMVRKTKSISSLIPICAWCKKVRDEGDEWTAIETFLSRHWTASFTHCLCPDCAKQVRNDIVRVTDQNGASNNE